MQPELEILISTTGRTDLGWLDNMFPDGYDHLHLLIVNQSTEGEKIPVDRLPPNIRVINMDSMGLSKSRNTALANAHGRYLLLADDDTRFFPGFERRVIRAHRYWDDPVLIFPFLDHNGRLWDSGTKPGRPVKRLGKVYSPQISLKRSLLDRTDIRFDEHFGLGTSLPDAENYIFLTQLRRQGTGIRYAGGAPLGRHPQPNSSIYLTRPRNTKARLAMVKYLYGPRVYPYFAKLMFFLWRHTSIGWKDIKCYWNWIRQWKHPGDKPH